MYKINTWNLLWVISVLLSFRAVCCVWTHTIVFRFYFDRLLILSFKSGLGICILCSLSCLSRSFVWPCFIACSSYFLSGLEGGSNTFLCSSWTVVCFKRNQKLLLSSNQLDINMTITGSSEIGAAMYSVEISTPSADMSLHELRWTA